MKNKGIRRYIYYFAFSLLALSRVLEVSMLIVVPDWLLADISIFVAILFFIKFLLDNHTFLEIAVASILSVLLIVLFVNASLPFFIVVAFLGFIAIKDIDIRTIIKIDLVVKASLLIVHLLFYGLDYIFDQGLVEASIFQLKKGTSVSLYFTNPNSAGFIGVWAVVDYLFLKRDKKVSSYILPSLVVAIVFAITLSRSSLLLYIVYVLLHLVRNSKILFIICRLMYPALLVVSFCAIMFITTNSSLFTEINSLFSGRLLYSIDIYNTVGINFLPNVPPSSYFETHIVDNFYIRCITYYGLLTGVLYYLPYLMMKKNQYKESAIISLTTAIVLFSESILVNIGYCPAYLIMADAVFNKEKQARKKGGAG